MVTKVWGVTGHRPERLGYSGVVGRKELERFALLQLARRIDTGVPRILTGMALGWDQAVAYAAIRAAVPFVAVLPCLDQHLIWPMEAQLRYYSMLGRATEVIYVHRGTYRGPNDLFARNRYIQERAGEVLALWDGKPGGGTTSFVKATSERVVNVWDEWVRFREACSVA